VFEVLKLDILVFEILVFKILGVHKNQKGTFTARQDRGKKKIKGKRKRKKIFRKKNIV
jgi:hypothetical protein